MIRKNTVKKYFNALQALKVQFENGTLNSIRDFEKEFKISNRTYRTLIKLNIIIKIESGMEFYYKWNDKIPVTMLLAQKVLSTNNEVNSIYRKGNATEKVKSKPNKQNVRGGARIGTGRPKTKSNPMQYQAPKKVSDVGLIRRFLRWIY